MSALVTGSSYLALQESTQPRCRAARPEFRRTGTNPEHRGDLTEAEPAPVMKEKCSSSVGGNMIQRVGKLHAESHVLARGRRLGFRDGGQIGCLGRFASPDLANVHQKHALRDGEHPRSDGQPSQVAAARTMNLQKRVLNEVVHAVRVMASRAKEAAKLFFESEVHAIEGVELAGLVRRHELAQIFVRSDGPPGSVHV